MVLRFFAQLLCGISQFLSRHVRGLCRLASFGLVRFARLGFRVTGSSPAAGQVVSAAPLDFTVNFSAPYDPASVQPADLRVNGLAASSVVLNDADTATFRFTTTPVAANGTQTMSLVAGAVTSSATHQAVAGWSATFDYRTGPAAPTNLAAAAASSSRINLTWRDNAGDEAGFKVEISSDGGRTFRQIGTVGANTSSVTVSGLASRTTYYFRVRAYSAAGDSLYSNVAGATTPGGLFGVL